MMHTRTVCVYTVSQEHTCPHSFITLTCINRFSKFVDCQNRHEICKKNCCSISHHNLNVFLHYLAKLKCLYIIIFDYCRHKRLESKYEFFSYLNLQAFCRLQWVPFSFRLVGQTMVLAQLILSEEDIALTDI